MRFITTILLTLMLTNVLSARGSKIDEAAPSCKVRAPNKCPAVSNCDGIIRTCDKAINGLKAEVAKQKEILGLQDKKGQEQGAEIERLRSRADSVINSKWLWFGLGLIGGVAAVHYATH